MEGTVGAHGKTGPMLTKAEHLHLQIEDVAWASAGPKDTAVRDLLGVSGVRHSQVVDGLIGRGDAELAYPALVHRLRRLRDARARVRRAG